MLEKSKSFRLSCPTLNSRTWSLSLSRVLRHRLKAAGPWTLLCQSWPGQLDCGSSQSCSQSWSCLPRGLSACRNVWWSWSIDTRFRWAQFCTRSASFRVLFDTFSERTCACWLVSLVCNDPSSLFRFPWRQTTAETYSSIPWWGLSSWGPTHAEKTPISETRCFWGRGWYCDWGGIDQFYSDSMVWAVGLFRFLEASIENQSQYIIVILLYILLWGFKLLYQIISCRSSS